MKILEKRGKVGDSVLDPFCGRGTTNYAARLCGLNTLGIDANPVAVAITKSKLVSEEPLEIVRTAKSILSERVPRVVPVSKFWRLAFHPEVLEALCIFREAFLEDCSSDSRIALRGIILGGLHGPKQKTFSSYFSNQCTRTYAPKPRYAVSYWERNGLIPENIDVIDIIQRRANRYYSTTLDSTGEVFLGDSRDSSLINESGEKRDYNWIITSPPYFGMKTYLPDQWLRNWFLGGSDAVDYSNENQVVHSSPSDFAGDLSKVWRNIVGISRENANLVIRFGSISNRSYDALKIIKESISGSGWCIATIRRAGSASEGRRQADTFLRKKSVPLEEYDIWARRE
jgi:hypothetical protein